MLSFSEVARETLGVGGQRLVETLLVVSQTGLASLATVSWQVCVPMPCIAIKYAQLWFACCHLDTNVPKQSGCHGA